MKLSIYRLNDEKRLEPLEFEELPASWPEDGVHRWLDVEGAEPEQLRQLLAPLNLHPSILESCAEPTRSPQVISREKALYIEVPAPSISKVSRPMYGSIVCLKTTLVTVHESPMPGIVSAATDYTTGDFRLNAANASTLLYHIFELVVNRGFTSVAENRARLEELAESLVDSPDAIEIDDIIDMRRQTYYLASVCEDYSYIIGTLLTLESEAFTVGDQREHWRDLNRIAGRVQHAVERLDATTKELHQYCLLALQDKTGNRLRLLTIISAVFLPLTLLAGIYGMNFENMPELDWAYGYPVILAVMAGIAGAMFWAFYRRGWFD